MSGTDTMIPVHVFGEDALASDKGYIYGAIALAGFLAWAAMLLTLLSTVL